jgi:hypothetical protein
MNFQNLSTYIQKITITVPFPAPEQTARSTFAYLSYLVNFKSLRQGFVIKWCLIPLILIIFRVLSCHSKLYLLFG